MLDTNAVAYVVFGCLHNVTNVMRSSLIIPDFLISDKYHCALAEQLD